MGRRGSRQGAADGAPSASSSRRPAAVGSGQDGRVGRGGHSCSPGEHSDCAPPPAAGKNGSQLAQIGAIPASFVPQAPLVVRNLQLALQFGFAWTRYYQGLPLARSGVEAASRAEYAVRVPLSAPGFRGRCKPVSSNAECSNVVSPFERQLSSKRSAVSLIQRRISQTTCSKGWS